MLTGLSLDTMTASHPWMPRVSRYAPHKSLAQHRHEYPLFCILLGGAYEENIRGEAHSHIAGDMMFCPANARHAQRIGVEGAAKLVFHPSPSSLSFLDKLELPLRDAPHMRSRATRRISARLLDELTLADSCSRLAAEHLLLELLATFARAAQSDRELMVPAWLALARDVIEDLDSDSITIDDLALQVGRHPIHLAREFRRYYGRTIGHYLREKRTARAALLLQAGSAPLAEIALSCGYADQATFTRAFKATHGVTPAVYRNRAR
jgi:AraC family transcriptional regulator